MLKKTLKAALLAFVVFASAMMIVALVITSIVRSAMASVPASVYETRAENGYTLKAYNGHIAVFYGDIKDSPAIETAIDVDTLRAVDRDKLDAGIVVESYDEVLKLLEDFGS
jgi:hypothetical protein